MTTGRTFLRSGGWVVVAALIVTTFAFALYAAKLLRGRASRAVGDGRRVESYGFSLEPCFVPRDRIVASGMPRDGLHALVEPASWTLAQYDEGARQYRKLLVPGDRVIGVSLGGQARAYPLRFVVWHEVVNDTLAGVPIAVTYNPLCDSAVVFRRTPGGRTLTFGVSGLLCDSNLLMYDRDPPGGAPSLWSQLLFRAIAGPAAASGATLEVLPISLDTWGDWRRENPGTTVLAPDPTMAEKYAGDPYTSYFGSDRLRFPVQPLPLPARYPLKTPLVALGGPQGWTAFPFPVLASRTQAPVGAPWAAFEAALTYRPGSNTVAIALDRLPVDTGVAYASYFAWYATHHADTTWVER
jgi:Protein of unknown function (DUF3179)